MEFSTEEEYEGYPQIENGVGTTQSLKQEFEKSIKEKEHDFYNGTLSIVAGKLTAPVISKMKKYCLMT